MKIGILPSINDNQVALNLKYLEYAQQFGEPIIITLNKQVDEIDWLWASGGADVDPTMFGYDNYASAKVQRTMDKFQSACIDLAVARQIPIFGICRGFQLLAYKFIVGGDVYISQHIAGHNQMDLSLHRDDKFHSVRERGGALMFVNSMHHQGLVVPSTALKAEEWITHYTHHKKGELLVEGFDFIQDGTRIQGVQWHPEELMEEYPFERPV